VPRRRFHKGNIIIRGKTPQRYGMYRDDVLQSNGTFKRVRRCVLLGPVSSLSERAAWKRFQPYLDRVNAAAKMPSRSGITLEAFVKMLLLFGGLAFVSALIALAEDGVVCWRWLQNMRRGIVGNSLAMLGGLCGFFIAGYTGVLLTVTNRPLWTDTNLLGLLFLLSAASTAAAKRLTRWRRLSSASRRH